ncbi:hypothetical protein MSIMFB_05635 [Mycobacterium simulans]|uniref:Uncharacterized protein n=1 Tax=Mycobacterium simulans TaxID=627089 RepID=A0A7Z7NCS5_9MYCO|nr:hypothetical protein MSIMFB_05635 [Mycobacterium simulans]
MGRLDLILSILTVPHRQGVPIACLLTRHAGESFVLRPQNSRTGGASAEKWVARKGWFSASSANSRRPWVTRLPECLGVRSCRKRLRHCYAARRPTASSRSREIAFWHPTNTSLPSVCTTLRSWAPTRISHPVFLLGSWRTISKNRGGKRMVMWSSGSSSRRTYILASSAPAGLSTLMSNPARQSPIPPGHNQIMRMAQNQEYHQ